MKYSLKKTLEDPVRIGCIVIGTVVFCFGVLFIPMLGVCKVTYDELNNYELIRSKNSIILEYSGRKISPLTKYDLSLVKFDTHKAVTEINDSTKFFIITERSFYNVPMSKSVVWSNYPYEKYNSK